MDIYKCQSDCELLFKINTNTHISINCATNSTISVEPQFTVDAFAVSVRLNGSRLVTGVLRGFDPFMNLVIDEAVEECKTGEKNHIGMVVCDVMFVTVLFF